MSDEQEAYLFKCAEEGHPSLGNSFQASWTITVRAVKRELDAERVHAAELQQRLDAQPYESESELVRLLAAREAEVVELREALEVAWGIIANAHGGDWSLASEQWQWAAARWRDDSWHAILSRAPGGNEALRALLRDALRRAHNAGWVHHQVGEAGRNVIGNDGWEDNDAIERSLLGPTGDGARKGENDA